MKLKTRIFSLVLFLFGTVSSLLAAPKSQTVYVKYPKTPFRSDTSLNAKSQLLNAGQEVLWQGVDEKQPQWQKVQYMGQVGYIALSNLSKKPPSKEFNVSASGSVESQDAQAFARSSAAAKALGDGALSYAESKNHTDIAAQIFTAEVISKQVQIPEDINAHAKKLGLTQHKGDME